MTKKQIVKLIEVLQQEQEYHRDLIKSNDQYKEFDEGVIEGLALAISNIQYILRK